MGTTTPITKSPKKPRKYVIREDPPAEAAETVGKTSDPELLDTIMKSEAPVDEHGT